LQPFDNNIQYDVLKTCRGVGAKGIYHLYSTVLRTFAFTPRVVVLQVNCHRVRLQANVNQFCS